MHPIRLLSCYFTVRIIHSQWFQLKLVTKTNSSRSFSIKNLFNMSSYIFTTRYTTPDSVLFYMSVVRSGHAMRPHCTSFYRWLTNHDLVGSHAITDRLSYMCYWLGGYTITHCCHGRLPPPVSTLSAEYSSYMQDRLARWEVHKVVMYHDDVIKWKHFRVTGLLCGEFTGPLWNPRTKASDAELWPSLVHIIEYCWLDTNFNEIWIEIHTFSFKKIQLKMSSGNGDHFVSASMC